MLFICNTQGGISQGVFIYMKKRLQMEGFCDKKCKGLSKRVVMWPC